MQTLARGYAQFSFTSKYVLHMQTIGQTLCHGTAHTHAVLHEIDIHATGRRGERRGSGGSRGDKHVRVPISLPPKKRRKEGRRSRGDGYVQARISPRPTALSPGTRSEHRPSKRILAIYPCAPGLFSFFRLSNQRIATSSLLAWHGSAFTYCTFPSQILSSSCQFPKATVRLLWSRASTAT